MTHRTAPSVARSPSAPPCSRPGHRLSQHQGALPPAAGAAAPGQLGHGGGAAGAVGSHGGPGHGGAAPGAPGAAGSAADVEARVALELRASRAEQELSALRHQVGRTWGLGG